MSRLLAQNPSTNMRLDFTITTVTTGAWVNVVPIMQAASSAVEIYNGSNSTLILSNGPIGSENSGIVPYYILPGGSTILLPFNFARGVPVSVKAVDVNTSAGSLILNFFG